MTKHLRISPGWTAFLAAIANLHCGPEAKPSTGEPDGAAGLPSGSGGADPSAGGMAGASGGGPASAGGQPDGGRTSSSTGGNDETGGAAPLTDGGPTTSAGFVNHAPPMGEPLHPDGGTALTPPAPNGWTWYEIEGAVCRDGTPTGFFVHRGTGDGLLWYLEGGGACSSPGFCNYNPASANMVLSGDGQTVIGSALGAVPGRQQPGVFEGGVMHGIFDLSNPANPFADWNMIYTPYCTGDVHFGTKENGTIPGVAQPQRFVGYLNMQKFAGRIVPTFKGSVSRVILTGASAGAFGAALNLSMVQDSFGDVPVEVVLDSGVPFTDNYMPPCMQQYWRDTWGLDDALPPDCEECFQADGGGMLKLADFLIEKHPKARLAAISSMQDEIIRLFFSPGLNDCATMTTADPVAITLGQLDPNVFMVGTDYESALKEVRGLYESSGRLATYLIGGVNTTFHQHIWRQRFYEPVSGGRSPAEFLEAFLDGDIQQVGP